MDPKCLQPVMLVVAVLQIQAAGPNSDAGPLSDGGQDLIGVPRPQLDSSPVANPFFRLLEQFEELLDRFAGDRLGLQQRPALVSNAVDPAVLPVPAGVTE